MREYCIPQIQTAGYEICTNKLKNNPSSKLHHLHYIIRPILRMRFFWFAFAFKFVFTARCSHILQICTQYRSLPAALVVLQETCWRNKLYWMFYLVRTSGVKQECYHIGALDYDAIFLGIQKSAGM